jgi:hypothetical protein
MGLLVKLQAEDGVALETVEDRRNLLHRVLPGTENGEYHWASTIDFYGDTTFNYLQVRKLRGEWRKILEASDDADTRQILTRIDELLERCASGVHLYVKFSGD